MHDPASPSASSPDRQPPQEPSLPSRQSPPPEPAPAPGSGPGDDGLGDDEVGIGAEEAHQIVSTVLAWYSRQLLLARRSGDQERLEELSAQRRTCVEDQARLRDAGPAETARIAADYTARFKELNLSEPHDGS